MPTIKKPVDHPTAVFEDRHLWEIKKQYGIVGDYDAFPIHLEQDRAVLLDVRSATSKKAILRSSEHQLFLKQIPWYADTDQDIEFRHQLVRTAVESGVAPKLHVTVDGRGYIRLDGCAYELWNLTAGRSYWRTRKDLASAAQALAHIHALTMPIGAHPAESYLDLVFSQLAVACDSALESGRNIIHRLAEHLELCSSNLVAGGWLSQTYSVLHGDFNPWNVVFTPERAVIVDWDNSNVGSRLRDVAEAALTFCAVQYREDSTSYARPFHANLNADHARLLLGSYFSHAPCLSESEMALLPDVVALVFLELSSLAVIRGELDDHSVNYINVWLSQHGPDLSRLITEMGS